MTQPLTPADKTDIVDKRTPLFIDDAASVRFGNTVYVVPKPLAAEIESLRAQVAKLQKELSNAYCNHADSH